MLNLSSPICQKLAKASTSVEEAIYDIRLSAVFEHMTGMAVLSASVVDGEVVLMSAV